MITVKTTDTNKEIRIGYPDIWNTGDPTWDIIYGHDGGIDYNDDTNEYTTTEENALWWKEFFDNDIRYQEALKNLDPTEKELSYIEAALNCDIGDAPIRGLEAIDEILNERNS